MTRPGVSGAGSGESGNGLRKGRALCFAAGLLMLLLAGTLEEAWPQQLLLAAASIAASLWLHRSSASYRATLILIAVSMCSTFRYAFWRMTTTWHFFDEAQSRWQPLDAFFIGILVLAECYAFLILYLGYLQTIQPLRRQPARLPDALEAWPEIDLLIPTYNEPLSVVRHTVLGSLLIDWPPEKLHVYLLDDGTREEFRAFAGEAGIGYITRADHAHAKAGNINHALQQVHSPLVAIFDCDHVPTRSFFQVTVGWFLRDERLGLVQTPHHFYSPDPFERNLEQFRSVPNEGELFYGVVQDGNDFWNATFFCGSCAILRRSALDEVGGIAVETVTEDAHTSLRLQMRGWNTAYINLPQAAGLATERLSGHIKQRIRWARGMVQILRTDNPLFVKGLRPMQRLCYLNAMTHFLYALPRLIFLSAPLIYLLLGRRNVPGSWVAIFAYALPHLVLSSVANSRIQGKHRHSFWNEVYETVLAPYILLPTMIAMLSPKLGKFNVTAKGGVVDRRFFDSRIAMPFLVMLAFNGLGLLCAVPRLWRFPAVDPHLLLAPLLNLPSSMYDDGHTGTVVTNVLWALLNSLVLGVALGVASESQQRRSAVRLSMQVPARVRLRKGDVLAGVTADVSSGGVMMQTDLPAHLECGEQVEVLLHALEKEVAFPAAVVRVSGTELRVRFHPLSLPQEEALTQVLYSRADTWLHWGDSREPDRPLHSLKHIFLLALRGLRQTLLELVRMSLRAHVPRRRRRMLETRAASLSLPVSLLTIFALLSHAALALADNPAQPARTAQLGQTAAPDRSVHAYHFTFADADTTEPLPVLPVRKTAPVRFILPRAEVATAARLRLHYRAHLRSGQALAIYLNGVRTASLPLGDPEGSLDKGVKTAPEGHAALTTCLHRPGGSDCFSEIALGKAMLVRENRLSFSLEGKSVERPRREQNDLELFTIEPDSSIAIETWMLPLNSAGRVPLQIFDGGARPHPAVRIAFARAPSMQSINAAATVASWLGALAADGGLTFDVSVDPVPPPNSIFFDDRAKMAGPEPRFLRHPATDGSVSLALIALPGDMAAAARAFVRGEVLWRGEEGRIQERPIERSQHPGWSAVAASWTTPKGAPLPDVGLFLQDGYPFTRIHRPSGTLVTMTKEAPPDQIGLLLTLMSRFGAHTRQPLTDVTVTGIEEVRGSDARDLLLIGTERELFATHLLPAVFSLPDETGSADSFPLLESVKRYFQRITNRNPATAAPASNLPTGPAARLRAAEWSRGSGRSVVLVSLRDDGAASETARALARPRIVGGPASSRSVLQAGLFLPSMESDQNSLYYAGPVSPPARWRKALQSRPEVAGLLVLFGSFVLALSVEGWLRDQAQLRLNLVASGAGDGCAESVFDLEPVRRI